MKEGRKDRRQFGALRIPAQLHVEIVSPSVFKTQTINVSQNGILIVGPIDQDHDDFVRLKVYLPPQQNEVPILGRIARKFKRHGKDAIGIQFIEIKSQDQNAWLEYISRIESLTLAQSALTSTKHLLQQRKLTGRSNHSLLFRFQSMNGLKSFLKDFLSDQGFFVPVPMMKSIGERIDLVLVNPLKEVAFETECEVLAPVGQFPSVERMGLKIKMLNTDANRLGLEKFLK